MNSSIDEGASLHQRDELVPRSYMQRARLLGGSGLNPASPWSCFGRQGDAARRP